MLATNPRGAKEMSGAGNRNSNASTTSPESTPVFVISLRKYRPHDNVCMFSSHIRLQGIKLFP